MFQRRSNYGLPHPDPKIIQKLESLVARGLVDELVYYDPQSSNLPLAESSFAWHQHSLNKRNIGLQDALARGCNQFISMDADEIYNPNQFDFMSKELHYSDFQVGAVQHLQYYKSNEYIKYFAEQECVSGLIKITPDVEFVYDFPAKIPIDPSRKPNLNKYRKFARFEIEMHHLSFVRMDFSQKYLNHGALEDLRGDLSLLVKHHERWAYPQKAMWAGNELVKIRKIKPRVNISVFQSLMLENQGSPRSG